MKRKIFALHIRAFAKVTSQYEEGKYIDWYSLKLTTQYSIGFSEKIFSFVFIF